MMYYIVLIITTINNSRLEFKVRPSLLEENQENYIKGILANISASVENDLIINISPSNFFVEQEHYINSKNIVEWHISELEITRKNQTDLLEM